jgi:hypothetical protein
MNATVTGFGSKEIVISVQKQLLNPSGLYSKLRISNLNICFRHVIDEHKQIEK